MICRLLPTNCLNVFDHFVGLGPKGLSASFIFHHKSNFLQEQSPERVIHKHYSENLSKIHRKAPALDSFFIEKAPVQAFPCKFWKVFWDIFYWEGLLLATYIFHFKIVIVSLFRLLSFKLNNCFGIIFCFVLTFLFISILIPLAYRVTLTNDFSPRNKI